MAAGALPFRVRAVGSDNITMGDAHMGHWHCPFPRHCYSLAADGRFDFLEGIFFLNSCDHIRRSFDVWVRTLGSKAPFFMELLSIPQVVNSRAYTWYREEMERMKSILEAKLGVTITDESIRRAIHVRNETRTLIGRLHDLRKKNPPALSGSDSLAVSIASLILPRESFN